MTEGILGIALGFQRDYKVYKYWQLIPIRNAAVTKITQLQLSGQ